jgi:uncharacterized protein HemX
MSEEREKPLSRLILTKETLLPAGLFVAAISLAIGATVYFTTQSTQISQNNQNITSLAAKELQDIMELKAQVVQNTQGLADTTSKYALLEQSIQTMNGKLDDIKKAIGK